MTADELCNIDTCKMAGAVATTTVGVAATQVIGANINRRTLHLFAYGASGVWVAPSQNVAVGTGLLILQSGSGVKLTIEEHGAIVTKDWWGIGSAGTDAIGYITVNDGK